MGDNVQSNFLLDLQSSGLVLEDLHARPLTAPEMAATNCPPTLKADDGYIIPYYSITGAPIPFYRVKLLNVPKNGAKYKQPKNTPNYIYFPPGFQQAFNKVHSQAQEARTRLNGHDPQALIYNPYVIVTEGEKKAACGCKLGFPTVGLGGVDNWRSRTVILPQDSQLSSHTKGTAKTIQVKLPSSHEVLDEISTLAVGLQQLIDLCVKTLCTVFIAFDSEAENKTNAQVQRAAATFGYELRAKGISPTNIRQVNLPALSKDGKTGLDDFLLSTSTRGGPTSLTKLLGSTIEGRSAFPKHPNPKGYVSQQLEHRSLSRRECQEVAYVVLTELDLRGRRLRSSVDNTPYYFDETACELMPVSILGRPGEPLYESPFGTFLYREYGLSTSDLRVLTWLASQYTGEAPINVVEPQRVCALIPGTKCLALQLSDSQYAMISPDSSNPIEIVSNGTNGLLFEKGQVRALDVSRLQKEIAKQITAAASEAPQSWWYEALQTTNVMGDEGKRLAALLSYISPFLLRWNGIQLPVEIFWGEPNSGKSSLYQLRMQILTGQPLLRNIPPEIKDWYAGITNSGGMYVIDNVQFADKQLRQKLSDEVCRLVTEPDPHVELRKLYTTSSLTKAAVKCAFGFTSISMPFQNADLIQRSAVFEMHAHNIPKSGWAEEQLQLRGGREPWVAHHLVVLHKFLQLAIEQGKWNLQHAAVHRLAFYEQAMTLMADVFDQPSAWIGAALKRRMEKTISETDWVLQVLQEFIFTQTVPNKPFTVEEISNWVATTDSSENRILNSSRALGIYMAKSRTMIAQILNIHQVEENKTGVYIVPSK